MPGSGLPRPQPLPPRRESVAGTIGRTARLSERLRRYVTPNPASPATRLRATPTTSPTWPRSCRPCAMRARTTWSSSAPGVLERAGSAKSCAFQHYSAVLNMGTSTMILGRRAADERKERVRLRYPFPIPGPVASSVLSSRLSSRARRSLPLRRQSTPSARRRSATWRLRRGSPRA
jgi:hypothetical protein